MKYRQRRQPKRFPFGIVIFVIVLLYSATILLWPIQPIKAAIADQPSIDTGAAPTINWPAYGQSAIGTSENGILATNAAQTPTPIASITKIVTALVVLEKKPIAAGQTGPTITLTTEDAVRYNEYFMAGGSIARSDAGMQLTEYQMLQAALISSANNYADSLAIWAYGSMDNYLAAANTFLEKHNLQNTKVADATGFSPESTSTASDLVLIGSLALKNPIIADIVSQQTTTINGLGTLHNTNLLLGDEGVIGMKTGTTDEAGSCLLYAVKESIGTETITLVGATLGAPTHPMLARDLRTALLSIKSGFKEVTLAKKGQSMATYNTPWGETSNAVPAKNIKTIVWSGQSVKADIDAPDVTPGNTSATHGAVTFVAAGKKYTADLSLDQPITTPSWLWRLAHPHVVVRS